MDKRSAPPVGVGVMTLLTVLLVLILAVFAALTFSTARSDLALSRINAETVSAWYDADARAAELYQQFSAGTDRALEEFLPITDRQSLYLHLKRAPDGSVEILAWQAVGTGADPEEEPLPVWNGRDFN